MKKAVVFVYMVIIIFLFSGAAAGCRKYKIPAAEEKAGNAGENEDTENDAGADLGKEETGEKAEAAEGTKEAAEELKEPEDDDGELPDNCRDFFSMAEKQGMDQEEAAAYLQILLRDNVFCGGNMKITGLILDDIDGNHQKDMLVMVLDAQKTPFYGSGCLWFYMNDDEPYCFQEESCSYYGWFDVFWADIDNDENPEIVFSAQGTGCGAVGDSYKAVFKYKNHSMERMELPSDFEEDYDCGINVEVAMEAAKDSYSAYCPYLDERVPFQAENAYEDFYTLEPAVIVGGNVRGYFDLRCVKYNGKNALQASEYLNGEGGIVHCVGMAEFIIVWDESGKAHIDKFWVESW